jgi:hypothetical protein
LSKLTRTFADLWYTGKQELKRELSSSEEGGEPGLENVSRGEVMPERCPECGAVLPLGSTCQTIFDELQMLELTYPEYYRVHFLSVACFLIQHGRYSDEALAWIQEKLHQYLEHQLTNQQLRRLIADETSSATRSWKIVRPADARPLPKIAWSMTIVDIVQSEQDAEQYGKQVKQWARITLQEMATLLS